MSTKSSSRSSADDATLEELKSLLAEAEKALSSAGDQVSDEVGNLRGRLREALAESKATARHALQIAKEQAARADQAIHTHPYVAIGIAAGVGILAGVLIGRSGRSSH